MNQKQKQFFIEYMKDFNATQAAIRAGYSARSARQIGNALLTKHDIADKIANEQKKNKNRAIMEKDDALAILSDIAWYANSERDRIAAISQASKMLGWDSPQKHEIELQEISVLPITREMLQTPPTPLEEVTGFCAS